MKTMALEPTPSRSRLSFAVWIGLAALLNGWAAEPAWQTDAAKALAKARAENKLVLLYFNGSDWCGDCRNLQVEVLQTTEFNTYAATHFVLAEIDLLSSRESSDREALVEKYEVRGWPTLVLVDARGDAIEKVVGYRKGDGPHAVIHEIEARRKRN